MHRYQGAFYVCFYKKYVFISWNTVLNILKDMFQFNSPQMIDCMTHIFMHIRQNNCASGNRLSSHHYPALQPFANGHLIQISNRCAEKKPESSSFFHRAAADLVPKHKTTTIIPQSCPILHSRPTRSTSPWKTWPRHRPRPSICCIRCWRSKTNDSR